ncbi:MAG: hypothetical protein H6Q05_3020 [Acidobacteria bacterium]|nr:hypothetical protein [Acidobacteriota bacterium]
MGQGAEACESADDHPVEKESEDFSEPNLEA